MAAALRKLTQHQITWLVGLAFLYFIGLFLQNAWVTEDAYITFRSVEQLFAGQGPRWNPHERVQTFTHPLWFGLLAFLRVFSSNLFLTSIVLSLALCLGALIVLFHALPSRSQWLLAVLLLCSSKAFIDFSSSGLETSLSYFLIVLFTVCLFSITSAATSSPRVVGRLRLLYLIAGFMLTCRHDLSTLILPGVLVAMYTQRHHPHKDHLQWALVGLSPFMGWTLFSLVYYGFPLPNTAYAKLHTQIPTLTLLEHGFYYLWNSLRHDAVSLVTIATAVVLAWRTHERTYRALGAGIVANVCYTVVIGGDFMSGRFLVGAFLLSALLLVKLLPGERVMLPFASILVAYAWLYPSAPMLFKTPPLNLDFDGHVADERSFYAPQTSLLAYLQRDPSRPFPDHNFSRVALDIAASAERVHITANIGVTGFLAGLDKIIIDPLAISDPFLASLPAGADWRIGHIVRDIPVAYVESVRQNRNLLPQGPLHDLYAKVALATQGQIWSVERFKAIWDLNMGVLLGRKTAGHSH